MSAADGETLEHYFALMNSNGAAQVYQVALTSGLLDQLGQEPVTCAELAKACQMQPRPTELVLTTLQSLGLTEVDSDSVDETSGRWRLTGLARMLLWGQYRELGNPYWAHLPEFLRTAAPIKKMDAANESEAHYQSQAASLGWMLAPAAEAAVRVLDIGEVRSGLSILDVGAGSGIWSLTIAREDPQTRVTALDWPAVLEVAQETAQNFGVEPSLTLLPGNYHEVEIPAEAFDLVILANVTHLETQEGNASLLRRLRTALRPGGEIAVIDVLPTSAESELTTSLYQLGLALRTEQGKVYSAEELSALMVEAGFAPPELLPLPAPPHLVGMLLAKRV